MAKMDKIADSFGKEAKRKQERLEYHLRVQAEKLALSAFSVLYGGAALTLPERLTALSELRQQYMHQTAGGPASAGEREGADGNAGAIAEATFPSPSSPDVTDESDPS